MSALSLTLGEDVTETERPMYAESFGPLTEETLTFFPSKVVSFGRLSCLPIRIVSPTSAVSRGPFLLDDGISLRPKTLSFGGKIPPPLVIRVMSATVRSSRQGMESFSSISFFSDFTPIEIISSLSCFFFFSLRATPSRVIIPSFSICFPSLAAMFVTPSVSSSA